MGLFDYGRRGSRGSMRKMGSEGLREDGALSWALGRAEEAGSGVPGPGATYSGWGEGNKKAVSPGPGLCSTSDPI